MASLHQLLKTMIDKGASDLHLTTGSPPQLRIHGELYPLRVPPLNPVETKTLCYSILTDAQKVRFEEDLELDLSFGVKNMARFRANVFMQSGAVAGAFRIIPFKILSLSELGLPPVVAELCNRPRCLILCTGPTGSGKSTTLASMVDRINSEKRFHIITIEDPIEYLHPHKSCLVNQREVGADTKSFTRALKYILRQDPDVVLIGEMRDLETIEAALSVAETGHLAFATLHTNSAVQTINRIVDAFPSHQQSQVRAQLSFTLEGVITQTLIPRASGQGRVLAAEVMIPNPAIRNLIREDKNHQIYSQMQIGQAKNQMLTLVRVHDLGLAGDRLPDGKSKAKVLRAIDSARKALPLATVLTVLHLSLARYRAWERAALGCGLDDRSSCPLVSPSMLTVAEIRAMREMVTSPDYRHMSLGYLAIHAQRVGKLYAAPSTWRKLTRERGWRRPRQRMPHWALKGLTPDEVYFGTDSGIQERIKEEHALARDARIKVNRGLTCKTCEAGAISEDVGERSLQGQAA